MPVQKRVSVIIPNYNHAPFLKQRIDSVLSQTFQDFELIILDDCSTDSSREIIEQCRSNPKISQIIFNTENSGGLFKQWIKGIENARGEYIWIAESDDYVAENFLEETLKVMQQDESLGMVFTNSNTVDCKGKFLWTTEDNSASSYQLLMADGNVIERHNASQYLLKEMIIANASSALFRKKSLVDLDFAELAKFINTGDRFVYLGISLASKIKYISKPLNFMRTHKANTTKKSFENGNIHKDRLRVLYYYCHQFPATVASKRSILAFYKEHYFHFINHCNYQDNLEVLQNVKRTSTMDLVFYCAVWNYLYLFKKLKIKSRFLRGIYYRILLLQK